MENFGIQESTVIDLLLTVLKEETIENGAVTITGTTGIGEGYTGLVIFAQASGLKEKKEVSLNFVVKHSTKNKSHRDQLPIRTAYKLESFVYENVLPAYQKLLQEHNLPPLDSFAKWYKTTIRENYEIMVFENLKTKGYKVLDRQKPLNIEHIKVVLEEYAKWHALAFALRSQKPDQFEEISLGLGTLRDIIKDNSLDFHERFFNILPTTLELNNEIELLKKVKKIKFMDLINITVNKDNKSAVLHGDCWNNNYMFKYEGNNRTTPEKMAIIDWQLASIGNPVADLSYAIFILISQENLDKVEGLVDFYYSKFSKFLESLGDNPKQLFSKEDFWDNWKAKAKVSILFAPAAYTLSERDISEIPDISKSDSVEEIFGYKNKESVDKRIIAFAQYLSEKSLI